MAIVPDDKDWTWVLDRRCPDCGFDSASHDVTTTGSVIRANAHTWQGVLAKPDVGSRPSPSVWSPLEYACHVRDVYRLFAQRLVLMLQEDNPLFANWDQDATALAEDYASQDPVVVARELAEAGEIVAQAFDSVGAEAWPRTGRRSDGATFTVASFARYFVHDPVHHLWDVAAA